MRNDKSSGCFNILLIALTIYGLLGWQCVLVWYNAAVLAIAIFVILAICTVVAYFNMECNFDDYIEPDSPHKSECKKDVKQLRDAFDRRLEFLQHLFVIAARLAKADGRVDESEVCVALRLFDIYHIPGEVQARLKKTFNEAISNPDGSTILYHAQCVSEYVHDDEVRRFLYEFLWDIACADGVLAKAEKEILRDICLRLEIDYACFDVEYARRRRSFVDEEETKRTKENQSDRHDEKKFVAHRVSPFADDYLLIGVSEDASDSDVKSAYRRMAKSYHPDVLRANNVPEDLIAIANEKMIRLNAAWARIQQARKI